MKTSSSREQLLPVTQEKDHKDKRMQGKGIAAALGYMGCAVLLVMFNKAALSSYKFPYANIITLLQVSCSNLLLAVLRYFRVISFTADGHSALENTRSGFIGLKTIRVAAPLSVSYLIYMVVGMASIRGVSVPMYTALRRTTVAFTMAMEFLIARQTYPPEIIFSVSVIVGGALLAGMRDLTFDVWGYSLVFASNLTTAVYLATIARLGKTTGLNSFGLMWCNGIICAPLLFCWTFLTGELSSALAFPAIHSPGFQLVTMASCSLAFLLNYTIFLNTALNSAVTQTICGNLKDLGTVTIGWLWFNDLPFDFMNLVGQGMGFAGSGFYAYCKLRGTATQAAKQ
ncbi:Nucleotide/sugar transporter family protein [Klebsormidium nitens]|uniref:Nucleotide/sugar transporter family protein n=1 Tax=Klebsormidium nitens TaxID=105231 RepID=A0A1Y1IAN9_KLENI|nr:Nucleotide/sugar transporter family protein [Klebsormidium nitens]|eukprot:GAQ85777.1 Nucleotide/sugar transporter family protein [Klebsormidium nitens]